MNRGHYDVTHSRDDICVVTWKDNGIVTMASNSYGVEPIQQAKRWDLKEKKEMLLDMPNVIDKYNQCMGGTDRQDQNVNKYRINIRSKKWWWPLFSWGIDVTIQNAWIIFRQAKPGWSLVQFRRYIARALLEAYGKPPRSQNNVQSNPTTQRRSSNQRHLLDDEPNKIPRRCKFCGLKTQIMCTTCNVHLHVKCNVAYHNM